MTSSERNRLEKMKTKLENKIDIATWDVNHELAIVYATYLQILAALKYVELKERVV